MKNLQSKTRQVDKPYEIWADKVNGWEWRVLKKYQTDDSKPLARWFTAVKSPFTLGSWEYGDTYVRDVIEEGTKIFDETEVK